jgi:two-component system NtrC family sensor kinase
MARPEQKLRFSFQTKVLLPVLAALVLLPAITLWIVNRSMTQQVQGEARQTLASAETVFQQLLELRTRDLVSRFRGAVNESSYRSLALIVASDDPKARETIRNFLNERLEAYGEDCEALLLVARSGTVPFVARRGTAAEPEDYTRATAALTRLALQGEPAHGAMHLRGHAYLAAAVPVMQENGSLAAALTVAMRLGDSALQELKSITGADILLLGDRTVTASTLRQPELPAGLWQEITANGDAPQAVPVEIQGDRYLALTKDYRPGGGQAGGFRYVLLSSYEQRMRTLATTRVTLLAVSLVGVLVSGLVVWFLIRRITQPLLVLRDSAEAVGGGDFTRRITRFSNDECGEVAEAFNRMTENLQASRAEVEAAVNKLKTTQAQLLQSEKLSAVGQFVAGVAHELNNPLTTVIGFSDLLQLTDADPKRKTQLEHIAKAATRCQKIVHSLLGFSRQHEPERTLVHLHEIVDAVVEIVAYDMRANNVTLQREYTPDLPPIMGDSHLLQQVILNIVSNARQALEGFRRDGVITLRTGTDGQIVWLRIKDNGPGIRRESLSRIFDPFYTTKPQGKGTGLGLSLSYGIIQEHRGRIYAESEPGEGAEFIIELPAAEAPAAVAPAVEKKNASAVPFKPTPALRVLVVDDEESILQLVQDVLRGEGHHVESTTSGQTALELITRHPYDIVVTDWKMPGLNGIGLYEELLRKNPAAARRMLFMTGDVIKENFQEFLRKYSLTCLPKPFAVREFRAAVARLVDQNPTGQ